MARPLMQPAPELDALVDAHQDSVQWYLRYCGCPWEEVPDLCQDTFLRLFRRIAQGEFEVRDHAATATWLCRTARHLWLQRLGRGARRHEPLDEAAAEAAWRWFERDDGGAAALEALRHCLGQLQERPRSALELQYRGGRSRRQIAAALGMTDAGAKTLLARTRQRLRQCVEGRLGT